ncbi:TPA: ATP-binding protein [Bacillus cereus]|jgi:DNA replication protein DnaC|uniref:ATP-binding protein n=1 Tax=Bacillus cereus TaxID=1396 RepID=UPI00330CEE3D|nr:ATP-binding protein [Bacillus cereus]
MSSDVCNNSENHKKPFPMLCVKGINDGKPTCPICYSREQAQPIIESENARWNEFKDNEKKMAFEKESLIADIAIKNARFENYHPTSDEARDNAQAAIQAAKDLLDNRKINLLLVGNCGAGKTHLAYAIGKTLQERNREVVFITMSELVRKIKSTFNKDSALTEDDIIRRLVEVEFLILDDLGAELGALNGNDKATRFINTILFSIFDGRQGKATIITTNLSGDRIEEAYDERIVSRLLGNRLSIVFKETKDFRRRKLEF